MASHGLFRHDNAVRGRQSLKPVSRVCAPRCPVSVATPLFSTGSWYSSSYLIHAPVAVWHVASVVQLLDPVPNRHGAVPLIAGHGGHGGHGGGSEGTLSHSFWSWGPPILATSLAPSRAPSQAGGALSPSPASVSRSGPLPNETGTQRFRGPPGSPPARHRLASPKVDTRGGRCTHSILVVKTSQTVV